jgi:hypothetical protein
MRDVVTCPVVSVFLVFLSKPPTVASAYDRALTEPAISGFHLDPDHCSEVDTLVITKLYE